MEATGAVRLFDGKLTEELADYRKLYVDYRSHWRVVRTRRPAPSTSAYRTGIHVVAVRPRKGNGVYNTVGQRRAMGPEDHGSVARRDGRTRCGVGPLRHDRNQAELASGPRKRADRDLQPRLGGQGGRFGRPGAGAVPVGAARVRGDQRRMACGESWPARACHQRWMEATAKVCRVVVGSERVDHGPRRICAYHAGETNHGKQHHDSLRALTYFHLHDERRKGERHTRPSGFESAMCRRIHARPTGLKGVTCHWEWIPTLGGCAHTAVTRPPRSPVQPLSSPNSVRTKYWVSKNSRIALIRPSWMANTETMGAS